MTEAITVFSSFSANFWPTNNILFALGRTNILCLTDAVPESSAEGNVGVGVPVPGVFREESVGIESFRIGIETSVPVGVVNVENCGAGLWQLVTVWKI